MSTTTAAASEMAPLDLIDVGANVRELDQAHVDALAGSIELRGLIVPLTVRPDGERFTLVAGHHRYAACRKLALDEVQVTRREQEGSSADSAAENVVRKQLSPLEEARAVQLMLQEGYTLDGAASVLGWSRQLVTARAKILELPDNAQQLLGSGDIPVSAVSTLTQIADVSRELCEAALAPVAEGQLDGARLASEPGWVLGYALRNGNSRVFAAYLNTLSSHEITELRLGKKTDTAYARAEALHRQIDGHAYGPPVIRFNESDVDQARAAGVLIEFEHGIPMITDKALYRELAKQAIERTLQQLQAAKQEADSQRGSRAKDGGRERTPSEALESEHRANMRALTERAHGTNLDLGAALLNKLAVVDPGDMDVARFFAYGLLGPDSLSHLGGGDHVVATIAANGIRLVIAEHRTTNTPTLKSGAPGKTKTAYGEVQDAAAWLWKFIDGASNAGELYGRTLVVFAAQHYAHNLVLSTSQRRGSVLPRSRKDTARKTFERITKAILPASHTELRRALEREARSYSQRQHDLAAPTPSESTGPQLDPDEDVPSEQEPQEVTED
jgi:ParB/RepB/Spo0J family partition protein